MSEAQPRIRTSPLKIPAAVYDRDRNLVHRCEHCMSRKPAPSRNRMSGVSDHSFGGLIFLDHGQVKLNGTVYLFLLILDGATNFISAYAQKRLREEETLDNV